MQPPTLLDDLECMNRTVRKLREESRTKGRGRYRVCEVCKLRKAYSEYKLIAVSGNRKRERVCISCMNG